MFFLGNQRAELNTYLRNVPTVCLTELDTTLKINNSYNRPDIDPQLIFFEGCKY